jgi:predicted metalloprotease with PDZ domain
MRPGLLFSVLLLSIVHCFGQKQYAYTVDLTKVVDDRVKVDLVPPKITVNEVVFYLPKIIPGTYAIADYGRLVHDFKALDKSGKELPVEKLDVNSWKIKHANRLVKVSYWVDDSFDMVTDGPSIFWPAGTNIEAGKNFVINTCGFFGYLENLKDVPYTFNIIRAREWYGSTGLIADRVGEPLGKLKLETTDPNPDVVVDVYRTDNYDQLMDSPLMYAEPDTAIIKVANTEVLISSYSPNKKITARQIAGSIREILMAQRDFLGGNLPVDKYAFIFYWTDQPVTQYGALEHSYSSLYYMPEATIEQMDAQVKNFAAHEFFHIVTPLTIHSEEIHRFGFNDPKMSRHLWLYEGVTEYFAGSVQVKYGLINRQEYFDRMRQKMLVADNFIDDVAFTDISVFTLDKYSDQFYNVYMKGALIAMCLDIKLLSLSEGNYGLKNLVADLGKKFGKSKPFKDEELFDEVAKLSNPEIGKFLKQFVGGPGPLPFSEIFDLVGINYEPFVSRWELSLGFEPGSIGVVQHDGKPMLMVANAAALNEQGRLCGFQQGDILLAINDEAVPGLNEVGTYIEKHRQNLREGEKITYTVLRKASDKDDFQTVNLSSTVKQVERRNNHNIQPNESATAIQLKIREAWLSP